MRRLETNLDGPILLEPTVHGDDRGFFVETARANVLAELGITDTFVQHNHSRSAHGVLRGMHFQPGMAKLVRLRPRPHPRRARGHPARLAVVRPLGGVRAE